MVINDLRIEDGAVVRGEELEIVVDGEAIRAFAGETVAAAILAAGRRVLRTTSRFGEARGIYCGIGLCFDCCATVDAQPNVRLCQTTVRPGLRVETQQGAGRWRLEP